MPGSATIGTNLVDSLLDVVDDLRGDLHPDMGVRQWRVYRQIRTWASGRVGSGPVTTSELEILPQPLVMSSLKYRLLPGGKDEDGTVMLTEISLTYTEDELNPPAGVNQQVLYVLRDAHGQSIEPRHYVVDAPPEPDRIQTIGWRLSLRRADVEAC